MFLKMFGGDGKTPEGDDESPERKRDSKGNFFTPIGNMVDGLRRSLTRSDNKNQRKSSADPGDNDE